MALETHVTHVLIERASKKDFAKLRAHLRQERAAYASGDWDAVRKLGAGFHALMAELAGNELLTRTLQELHARIALILQIYKHDYGSHWPASRTSMRSSSSFSKQAVALPRAHLGKVEQSLNTIEMLSTDNLPLRRALQSDLAGL